MFASNKRVKELEDELKSLKKRIFMSKPLTYDSIVNDYCFRYISGINIKPKSLEEDFFDSLERIEDRIKLITKFLGIDFIKVDKKEAHEEVRVIKQKETPKRPVGRPRKYRKYEVKSFE